MDSIADKLGVSTAVAIVLGALVIAQLALQVYCLIDLVRRPAVVGGRKWVWALVIVFVSSIVGSVLYLAVGRQPMPEPLAEPELADVSDAARTTQDVVDLLYGPRSNR